MEQNVEKNVTGRYSNFGNGKHVKVYIFNRKERRILLFTFCISCFVYGEGLPFIYRKAEFRTSLSGNHFDSFFFLYGAPFQFLVHFCPFCRLLKDSFPNENGREFEKKYSIIQGIPHVRDYWLAEVKKSRYTK